MKFVDSEKQLLVVLCESSIEQYVLNSEEELAKSFKIFKMDSDQLFKRRFFNLLEDISRTSDPASESFFLLVINPHPINYFKKNLNFFPAIEFFPSKDDGKTFLSALNIAPQLGNIADSIASRAEEILIFPAHGLWKIFVRRDGENSGCYIGCNFNYNFSWDF